MLHRQAEQPVNAAIDHAHFLGWYELVCSLKHLRRRLAPDVSDERFVELMGQVPIDTKGKTGMFELLWEEAGINSALKRLRRFEDGDYINMHFAQAYAYAMGMQVGYQVLPCDYPRPFQTHRQPTAAAQTV